MSTRQLPTCTGIRIRSPSDAHVVFHAVSLGILPMVSRRLDVEERRFIHSGCVFVWEERCQLAEATGVGIERWTDGRRWGPSRVRDDFLYYQEKLPEFDADEEVASLILGSRLIKQTYSIFVDLPAGRRKWHLVAYFTQANLDTLHTVDDVPQLSDIRDVMPAGKYITARSANRLRTGAGAGASRPDDADDDADAGEGGSGSPSSSQRSREASPGASTAAPVNITLPALKPPPWREPTWVLENLGPGPRLPDLHGAQAQARASRPFAHERAIPPLVYMMTSPYPPRNPADNDLLRMFDVGMV